MKRLSIRLPESLHKKLKELAEQEGVSKNQLVTLALSEKISALLTVDYLKERSERASKDPFQNILAQVPDVVPEEFDRL